MVVREVTQGGRELDRFEQVIRVQDSGEALPHSDELAVRWHGLAFGRAVTVRGTVPRDLPETAIATLTADLVREPDRVREQDVERDQDGQVRIVRAREYEGERRYNREEVEGMLADCTRRTAEAVSIPQAKALAAAVRAQLDERDAEAARLREQERQRLERERRREAESDARSEALYERVRGLVAARGDA